jgi:hypothetical protein
MNSLLQIWPFISENDKAVNFAFANGLLKGSNKCKNGKCRSRMNLERDSTRIDGKVWRCRTSQCRSKRSIRENSFFSNSHLEMSKILMFVYLWSKDCPSKFIKEELEIDQKTAVNWNRFCRDIACHHYETEDISSEKIGIVGKVIEIDESVFSKRKYHRGRLIKDYSNTWVFGGVNREDSSEMFVEIVPNRTKETLLEVKNDKLLNPDPEPNPNPKPLTLTLTLTISLTITLTLNPKP